MIAAAHRLDREHGKVGVGAPAHRVGCIDTTAGTFVIGGAAPLEGVGLEPPQQRGTRDIRVRAGGPRRQDIRRDETRPQRPVAEKEDQPAGRQACHGEPHPGQPAAGDPAHEEDVVLEDECRLGTAREGMQRHRAMRFPDPGDHLVRMASRAVKEHALAEPGAVQLRRGQCRAIGPLAERDAVGGVDKGPVGRGGAPVTAGDLAATMRAGRLERHLVEGRRLPGGLANRRRHAQLGRWLAGMVVESGHLVTCTMLKVGTGPKPHRGRPWRSRPAIRGNDRAVCHRCGFPSTVCHWGAVASVSAAVPSSSTPRRDCPDRRLRA